MPIDYTDVLAAILLTAAVIWLVTYREARFLHDRIRAQNEEIERLSRIIDGYRSRAKENVGRQFNQTDWPEYL